jgi:hypothetical protein
MLAAYEAAEQVVLCAWCKRATFDGRWLPVPQSALTAIEPFAVSYSICPACSTALMAAELERLAESA